MYFSSVRSKFFVVGHSLILILMAVIVMNSAQAGMLFGNVSGVYVANYINGVAMIQLVETSGNHLTGSYMLVAINTADEVITNNSGVTGAVGGSNISLTLTNSSKSISAVVTGDNIRVIGLDDNPTVFQKSDINEFEKKVAIIKATSQSNLVRKSEEAAKNKFVSDIDSLNNSMTELITVSENLVQQLGKTEKRLQDITKKMDAFLEKERQLSGNPNMNAGSAQMQLVSSIKEGQSITRSLQWDFFTLQTRFRSNQQTTYNRADEMEPACKKSKEISACDKFLQILPVYRGKYAILKKCIDSWETVYKIEESNQDRIFKQAEDVQNARYKK
jgi:hypothetical protein